MKLSQKEIFILELEKQELDFFLDVIHQMKLSEDSSPSAVELCSKFKNFRANLLGDTLPTSTTPCDGCSATTASIQLCPITNTNTPLCSKCYELRLSYNV